MAGAVSLCLTRGLLALLFASPAVALEFRRVGELRPESNGSVEWLDPHRYVRLTNDWERSPAGKIRAVTFVVADVVEQKILRLPFDLEAFRKAHTALFPTSVGAHLAYFDGTSALLKFDRREPGKTVAYFSVWDIKKQTVTEPKPLGETLLETVGGSLKVTRVFYLVGPDPGASRLYFAVSTLDEHTGGNRGPVTLHLFRATFPQLTVDWEMDVPLPRRKRQLPIEGHMRFSSDGKRLALAEYYDRAAKREFEAVPPPQVYVIDLEAKKVAQYPIPTTPYGLSFSRDGRYLAVGSHEQAEIIRIDLEAGRIDRRTKAQTHIQTFATTASGDSLLVFADHLGAPRSIEVRRWSDLGLQETLPISSLFPGLAGVHPSGVRATADGRYLVAPLFKADGYPDSNDVGLVTFEILEGSGRQRPDPVALARQHIERSGVKLYSYELSRTGNTEGFFAPIVANEKGEALAVGTTSDRPEDAPFQAGKSHPMVLWIDSSGKLLWKRSLRSGKTFLDYEGGSAVATPDGAFVVFILGYVHPGGGGTARLVKLDRKGKHLWEWTAPLGKDARHPDSLQLLPSGTILMKGHVGTSSTPWIGELDARTGKLLRDEVGAQAP